MHTTRLVRARMRACRRSLRSWPRSLDIARRRIFLAQRRSVTTQLRRAARRRARRVNPRKRRRYSGKFGKRRRRIERRDNIQLARRVACSRPRAALRRGGRHAVIVATNVQRGYYARNVTVLRHLLSPEPAPAAYRIGFVVNTAIKRTFRLLNMFRGRRDRQCSRMVKHEASTFNRHAIRSMRLRERKRQKERLMKLLALGNRHDRPQLQSVLRRKGWARQLIRSRQSRSLLL